MSRMCRILATIALMGLMASAVVAQQQAAPAQAQAAGGQLTAEQQTQLQAKVKEMRKAGASREEIQAAIQEMCKGWGVQPPQGKGGLERFGANLTEEQRTLVQAKIKEMRAAGAKPEEIKAAVREMLKGWGVQPAQAKGPAQAKPLTDEQWMQLEAKLKELKGAGATPEQINAAMGELFKGWGVEPGAGAGKGLADRFGANLTEEQRTQVQAKIKDMRAAGAKPEEIKAAVQEMLKGWGVQMPEGKGQADRWGANLTEEQRTQLQAKIKEMRGAGAKPEEIRAAVQEMYKGWGLQMPERDKGVGNGLREQMKNLTDEERRQVLTKIDEMQKAGSPPEKIKRTIMEMIKGFGDKA